MAARARTPRRRHQTAATGTALLHDSPAIRALDAAQAHAEWIVAVEALYQRNIYDVAHAEVAEVDAVTDRTTAETFAGLDNLDAAELHFVAYHRFAHDTYAALVSAAPVEALPAPFARPAPEPCGPEVRELEATPMGRLADRLAVDDATRWPAALAAALDEEGEV